MSHSSKPVPAEPGRGPAGRRRYNSTRRQESAACTRRRILEASQRLFAERGFGEATITAIARQADVSAASVYATFGSKAGLLGALLTDLEQRADVGHWLGRIHDADGPAQRLALFAGWSRSLYAEGDAVIRAAYRASADPAVRVLHDEGNRRRREGLHGVIDRLADDGSLRSGLDRSEALDRAVVLTSPATYLACVDGCGWTGEHYEQWLAELLVGQLLSDRPVTDRPADGSVELR